MENKIEHFKPDFFVPGAAKSGTTTLHDLLSTHHDISMSKEKEPVYWNNKLFRQFKLFEVSRYANLFEKNRKIKGESTTSYMYYDSFISNIKANFEYSPKFIFVLRNPVDRYVSHVNWLKGLGLEKKDVNQVINEDDWANFSEYDDYPKQYYQFGLYNKWITRFIKNFGKKNIKIITFEQLISDRLKTLNSCYEFLGVEKVDNLKVLDIGLNFKPWISEIDKSLFSSICLISDGLINFSYSCVPFGNKFKIYSAPTIAKRNDLGFLLMVEKKMSPFFLQRSAHVFTS